MAEVTTFETKSIHIPLVEGRALFAITVSFTTPTSGVDNADTVKLFDLPADMTIVDAVLTQSATLGASATIQLQKYDGVATNLTAATTAGAASTVRGNQAVIDTDSGDDIRLLVGGANVTAAAVVTATVIGYRR